MKYNHFSLILLCVFKIRFNEDAMKTLTYTQFKNNISKIFAMVKNGEEIIVSKNKSKEKLAVILPYEKYQIKTERPLGILKGKATFKIKDDFKMTEQELLDS